MPDQSGEIAVRNRHAKTYDKWYLKRGPLYDFTERKSILMALSPKSNEVIWDAGCGTGRLTCEIAKYCKKVFATDFSSNSIEILRGKAGRTGIDNITCFEADLTSDVNRITEPVDKILSVQVIQHIPTAELRERALALLYRKLRPGGSCIVVVYNWLSQIKQELKKEGEFSTNFHYFRFTPDEIRQTLGDVGFKSIVVVGCNNFLRYHRLKGVSLYKICLPVAWADIFFSRFPASAATGDLLICRAEK